MYDSIGASRDMVKKSGARIWHDSMNDVHKAIGWNLSGQGMMTFVAIVNRGEKAYSRVDRNTGAVVPVVEGFARGTAKVTFPDKRVNSVPCLFNISKGILHFPTLDMMATNAGSGHTRKGKIVKGSWFHYKNIVRRRNV